MSDCYDDTWMPKKDFRDSWGWFFLMMVFIIIWLILIGLGKLVGKDQS